MMSFVVALVNNQKKRILLLIEPWCHEIELDTDEKVVLTLNSEYPGFPEIFFEEDGSICVYGWQGCGLSIEAKGYVESNFPRVPNVPPVNSE